MTIPSQTPEEEVGEPLPDEANPKQVAIHRIKASLRATPGLLLIRNPSEPPPPGRGKWEHDVGLPDVVGTYLSSCVHRCGCRIARPFAFLVMVQGYPSTATQENGLVRLRHQGWVTSIVSTPAEVKVAMAAAEKVLGPR